MDSAGQTQSDVIIQKYRQAIKFHTRSAQISCHAYDLTDLSVSDGRKPTIIWESITLKYWTLKRLNQLERKLRYSAYPENRVVSLLT